MKWVADENVDKPIVDRLRGRGDTVLYVPEMEPGVSDDEILRVASQESAILVTGDKGFGELVFRQGRAASGVLLLRLAGLTAQQKADVVSSVVETHGDQLEGAFAVLTPTAVRVRRPSK